MKKRITAALLAMFMLLGTVSCSDNSENSDTDTGNQTEQAAEITETEEEDDGKTHYFDSLNAEDYDGWTLHIANDGASSEYFSLFTTEELTGDEFNDGIFNRQVSVEEKFNVKVLEDQSGSTTQIKNCVTSGSHDVAFGYVLLASCMGLITGNYVLPISDLPTIDMTKPYWDQGAQATLRLFGKMYYGYCDISFDHYESMAVMFYNGNLLTDAGINEQPYELEQNNKWTLDKMYGMMTAVAMDKNGDGKMKSGDDIFGWSGRDFEFLPSLYSSGVSLMRYDAGEETYKLNVTNETVMAVGDWMNKIVNDKNLSLPGRNDETRNLFKEGGVLFYSRLLGDFRNLRDKEDDYGIIAFPALNEGSDRQLYVQNPYSIMVPSDCSDTERLGALLEALGAYTYDNILDIYINRAVIGKGARDQESATLLRYYITIRAFDLTYAFGLDSIRSSFATAASKGSYASTEEKMEKSFNKTLKKSLEALKGE